MKRSLPKELKEEEKWNEELISKVRLYLYIDSQVLKHSEYLTQSLKENAKNDSLLEVMGSYGKLWGQSQVPESLA